MSKTGVTIARGDRLQLKANARAEGGERVANGEIVTVHRVESNGRIHLQDGRTLGAGYRQFNRGYAVTSYGSQGKTVDQVLFSDSAIQAATNARQWYVTISRGRLGIRIFTADKNQLRENILHSGDRALALDLIRRLPGQIMRQKRFRSFARLWKLAAAFRSRIAAFITKRRGTAIHQEIP